MGKHLGIRLLIVSLFLVGTMIGLRMQLEAAAPEPALHGADTPAGTRDAASAAQRIAPVLHLLLLSESEAAVPEIRIYMPLVAQR